MTPPIEGRALRAGLGAGNHGRSKVRVRACASRLLKVPVTVASAEERLRRYSLREALDWLGRIDAVLFNSGNSDEDVQVRLLAHLVHDTEHREALYRRARLVEYNLSQAAGEPAGLPVFFEPAVLAATAVLAGRVLEPEAPDTGAPPDALVEAVLVMNDLLPGAMALPRGPVESPEHARLWTYGLSMLISGGRDPVVHRIVRTVELFLEPDPALAGDPDYIDLAALYREHTGLELREHLLAIFAFPGQLLGRRPEDVLTRDARFVTTMFGGDLRFTPERAARVFDLVGAPAAAFREACRTAWPEGDVRPHLRLPLERSPLVRFGTVAVCPSVHALEERLTAGLLYLLLDAANGRGKKCGDQFLRFFGRIFERHVLEGAARVTATLSLQPRRGGPGGDKRRKRGGSPTRPTRVRLVPENELLAAALASAPSPRAPTPSVCDGALLDGPDLVLFDAKANRLPLDARSARDADQFFERLNAFVLKAARQVESTLHLVRDGRLQGVGLDPAAIRHVYPVAVAYEDWRLQPLLTEAIRARLAVDGLLQDRQLGNIIVAPLEICDISDWEWLELAAESTGASLGEMIGAKQASPFWAGYSMADWLRGSGMLAADTRHRLRHHRRRYQDLSQVTVSLFRDAERSTPGQAPPGGG